MRTRFLVLAAAALVLAACAAQKPTRPVIISTLPSPTQSPSTSTPTAQPISPPGDSPTTIWATPAAFSELPGWANDDHVAALSAFVASCPRQRDAVLGRVCQRALALTQPSEAQAKRFFEVNFVPEPELQPGLLTGYFTPIYAARAQAEGEFTEPLRPRPADLPARPGPSAYADRATIERRASADALAWMRPEDLFFLQIQGSGVLVYPDGARRRAVFDGSNGAPFLGIALPLRQEGLLENDDTSATSVHAWLAENRGSTARAMMDRDRRYVFFRLEADDGKTPTGAAGARLIPGRAVAVDPTRHAMGEMLWIDARAPELTGAFPVYQRLALALDTGGAIKGEVRADLYLGEGPDAGLEAGRVRHVLRLYRLEPIDPLAP